MNTWKRKALALLAVVLLSVPSAIGVQKALAPTRGNEAATLAALGFELVYLSTAVLLLSDRLRAYARRVALSAVGVAVVLNTIADYQHRVPDGLSSWGAAVRLFDPLLLVLSLVESAPLAVLAYAMAQLLHQLDAGDDAAPAGPSWRERLAAWWKPQRQPEAAAVYARPADPVPALAHYSPPAPTGTQATTAAWVAARYACPSCGAALTQGQYGAARKHGRCRQCPAPL